MGNQFNQEAMTDRQLRLLHYVITQHGTQVRKYNLEPYWFHLYRVGRQADLHVIRGLEIGFCHDLVEDVPGLTFPLLTKALDEIGYNKAETDDIVTAVYHLTDIYTPESYPDLNRAERKKLEAHRLWEIPRYAQTVKYCDLIDNTSTIVPYDQKFGELYLKEKSYILKGMNKGNKELYEQCIALANKSFTPETLTS